MRRFVVAVVAVVAVLAQVPRGAGVEQSVPPFATAVVAGSYASGHRDGTGGEALFGFVADWLSGIARDASGNLYVSDTQNHLIRKISPAGVVSTFAGAREVGFRDGTGTDARFYFPQGIGVDATGHVFVADSLNSAIRRITPSGEVTTWYQGAGVGAALALAPDGSIYVTTGETQNRVVNRITPSRTLEFVAGGHRSSDVFRNSVDGVGALAEFTSTDAIVRDPVSGDLWVADGMLQPVVFGTPFRSVRIRRVTPSGVVTTLRNAENNPVSFRDSNLGLDGASRLIIAGTTTFCQRFVPCQAPRVFVVDGGVVHEVTRAVANQQVGIHGLVALADGTLAVTSQWSQSVLRLTITNAGSPSAPGPFTATLTELAGRDLACSGLTPADGPRRAARFCDIRSVALGPGGSLVVADAAYNRDSNGFPSIRGYTVRRLARDGTVTTLAGSLQQTGVANGAGSAARFGAPDPRADGVLGVAVDAAGVVYVADMSNSAIRRVDVDGTTSTLAGAIRVPGSADGAGTDARFQFPHGIAVGPGGDIFVADTGNSTIRRVTATGVVTTVAGLARHGGTTDGLGADARFATPYAVAVGPDGTVFVADTGNHTIRTISPAGVVATLAGTAGQAGIEDGVGTAARFNTPRTIAVGVDGTVYVGQQPGGHTGEHRIRQIAPDGTVTTVLIFRGHVGAVDRDGVVYLPDGPVLLGGPAETLANRLTATPATLRFGARKTGAAGALTLVTPPQAVMVSSEGGNTAWTATADQPWVSITNGSNSGSGSFTAAIVDPSNTIGGRTSLTATITITSTTPGVSSVQVPVTLQVDPPGAISSLPFGHIDSPVDGTTGLAGAIAMTGWALDDVGVQRVEIWRNCVAQDLSAGVCTSPLRDGATSHVFVGEAAFLAGARPDVELAFPLQPQARQAGWGLLILSNNFPHIGNNLPVGGEGTFTLSVYAFDIEGQMTFLGAKSVTVNNDAADLPFGTLDTPLLASLIPGASFPFNQPSAYPVFGWAMTQPGKCIDTGDPTRYRVIVNGVARPLTPGVNWFAGLARPDLAAAFPGRCNSGDALAVYYLDVQSLGNGRHTISWDVTDSDGKVAGIGSRFFDVLLPAADALSVQSMTSYTRPRAQATDRASTDVGPVSAHTGRDGTPWTALERDAGGVYVLSAAMQARVVIDLGAPVVSGEHIVGTDRRALPTGSTLDPATGRFYWQPPIGFAGTFELRFVTTAGEVTVRVTWGP